jgi:hypothetical protein
MDRKTAQETQKKVMAYLGWTYIGDGKDGYPRFRPPGAGQKKGLAARTPKYPLIGVGITLPVTQGDIKGYGVRISCQRKADLNSPVVKRAQTLAPPGETIPAVYIGKIALAGGTKKKAAKKKAAARRLLMGDSIGRAPVAQKEHYGSIGCFVKRATAPGDFILSCHHVLADPDFQGGQPLDKLLSPARKHGGTTTSDHVADLDDFSNIVADVLDCAVAKVRPGVSFDATQVHGLPSTNGPVAISGAIVTVQNLDVGEAVQKVGRRTGGTSGKITSVNEFFAVSVGQAMVGIEAQLGVRGNGNNLFADRGDSGSVVFNQAMDAAGMVVAVAPTGNLTFCHPILPVFDHFKAHF